MNLFLPDSGLVIWMLIAFGVVLFILAKFAWPIIMNSVKARNEHIADSLKAADEANAALSNIEQKSKEILAQAQAEQIRVMKDSQALRTQMIEEAKAQARKEADKIVAEARLSIEKEKNDALSQVKGEVAALSIAMAEKLLQRQFEDKKEQSDYINRILKQKDQINA